MEGCGGGGGGGDSGSVVFLSYKPIVTLFPILYNTI